MWLAGLLATFAVAAPAEAAPRTGLSWQDCGDGLLCAQLTVPVDWTDPDGARTTLSLTKLPARDQARKQGVLYVNSGGPATQAPLLRNPAFAGLTDAFDLVVSETRGFDTISCPMGPLPAGGEWVFPDRSAYETYVEENQQVGRACAEAAGPLAGKLDSRQVAHDLEAVRTALGERKLNYFGNSYGTVYGQAYAELFPRRVGRMYLDSVKDHTNRSILDWVLPRATTAERNLHRLAEWCAREPSCALHGRDLLAVWDDVIRRAEQEPIPGGGTTVSATKILSRTDPQVEQQWPMLATALAQASAGDATAFAGSPPPGAGGPGLGRQLICADFPYPSDYRELKSLETKLRTVAPRLGWVYAWQAAVHCAGLPVPPTYAPHPFRANGLPPVLIVNGEGDSTTPPQWARRLASQLPGARYVPASGGHARYLSGDACVRGHADRYLTTGALPPAGTRCG
ncbi:alpha/beta hydrolase [Kibdelosporangium persicum]|uniref:Pimeloyl-ACP methyl ester carboxylesterase n=2 Tax=Kibdelosporangium persicum TaxID=2698649 RepID=A0ABX2FIA0_9PSEU|nr:Pimeloyl-ACP methyl ester carboxylesterase [Kibdelosporangium persicum]